MVELDLQKFSVLKRTASIADQLTIIGDYRRSQYENPIPTKQTMIGAQTNKLLANGPIEYSKVFQNRWPKKVMALAHFVRTAHV